MIIFAFGLEGEPVALKQAFVVKTVKLTPSFGKILTNFDFL
jgi:hypothetical protein